MPYTVKYLDKKGIVETVYTGILSIDEVKTAVDINLEFALEHDTNLFLVDCLEMDFVKRSILENYELAKHMARMAYEHSKSIKDAIILPRSKEAAQNMLFFETTARNRGLNVRVFTNRQEAVNWLLDNQI